MITTTIIIFALFGLGIIWLILSAKKQSKKLNEEGWKKKVSY